MKNFIFISPHFPSNYWRFCAELKRNGFNVLGIGDCVWGNLASELKENLNEYYYVHNLEDYEEVFRAVAFFTFKYGKIDWLESNNEYWLERDASLRTAFNINTGFQKRDIKKIKFKSCMKKFYEKAGIKAARYCLVKNLKACKNFIEEVGYPVIAKPDNGVGANFTYKISSEEELEDFLKYKKDVAYIMEEFIDGEVVTYDAVVNSHGQPLFETGNITPTSLMDVVNNNDNSVYYIVNELAEDVRAAGRATVKAFGVKSRFIHFEFFRLTRDQHIGNKGEVVALEVNMRPAGGFTPDMMNFANSTNVYKIWADAISYDSTLLCCGDKYFCAFAGRRDGKNFLYSEDEIAVKYKYNLKTIARIPDVLSGAMGNTMFLANFKTKKEMDAFYKDVLMS